MPRGGQESERGSPDTTEDQNVRLKRRGGFKKCVARAGVLVPRSSGLAERPTTHSSTSGPDECKLAVHNGARDSLSLECLQRPQPRVEFVLPAG